MAAMEWFTPWFTAPGYGMSRLVLQRALAAVYLVAFLSAAMQFPALLGERGLLPAARFVRRIPFRASPSLFHWRCDDRVTGTCAWAGVLLAAAVLAGAADAVPLWASMVMWALLWFLYLSFVNVGQIFYSFGWESLLLEAGFLAIFLGNARTAPPVLTLWLMRWLLFRVEFGAGLVKWRGDQCWRNLTCLYYHHETQPMPGPLSWYFHHLPKPLHRVEVAANHVAQLIVPFGLFFPQPVASIAAGLIIVTQLWLVMSGNFSWLNWLTIVLAFAAVDFSGLTGTSSEAPTPLWFGVVVCAAALLIVVLSYWPARNLVSRSQQMNRSFNPLHLVNTYGAFGSVTRVRQEIVLEGTEEERITRDTVWREYEFKGKPGNVLRLPRQFAPYHLRLDWQMWFAALSPAYTRGWFEPLVERLLVNDRKTLRLLRTNPFPGHPPAHVRAVLYRYRFTTRAERRETGAWWHRTYVREFLPPVRIEGGSGGSR
ncbi:MULTISPECIES: lipase maturation factor family protein [Streptomyces]|uniref:Lipase maturation factor family protein n=1 Tax=Streptomyces albus TaxID=1888 RepID=A0A8H1LJ87_9ACTN|nr:MULTISPECIES: lipase maturation factor family protein [Streptomyces]TGG86202.1 lipase maturation factor family protein [Streptomyces albus]UVN53474.1 lipase maturation factor family protein [Streptomyces albus]